MAWLSFIELDKAMVHVIRLARSVIMVSVCLPSDALFANSLLMNRKENQFVYIDPVSCKL